MKPKEVAIPRAVRKFKTTEIGRARLPPSLMGQGLAGAVARREARPPNFFTPSLAWMETNFVARGKPRDHEKLWDRLNSIFLYSEVEEVCRLDSLAARLSTRKSSIFQSVFPCLAIN